MAKDENYCEHCNDEVSHTTETHEFDAPEDYGFERALWNKAGPNPLFNDRRSKRSPTAGQPGLTSL